MATVRGPASTEPPDPGLLSGVPELVEGLRALKIWAGSPSYENITDRINQAWSRNAWAAMRKLSSTCARR